MHSNTRTIKLNYSTTTNWIYINLKLTWDQKNFKNSKGLEESLGGQVAHNCYHPSPVPGASSD